MTPDDPDPQRRRELLGCLALMPDEAFDYVLVALARSVWPDSLGGFRQDSRDAITRTRAEANRRLGL